MFEKNTYPDPMLCQFNNQTLTFSSLKIIIVPPWPCCKAERFILAVHAPRFLLSQTLDKMSDLSTHGQVFINYLSEVESFW